MGSAGEQFEGEMGGRGLGGEEDLGAVSGRVQTYNNGDMWRRRRDMGGGRGGGGGMM